MQLTIPYEMNIITIKVFVRNNSQKPVYFDDFYIRRIE